MGCRRKPGGLARPLTWMLPALLIALAGGCAREPQASPPADGFSSDLEPGAAAFLDTLQRRTFDWFWEQSDPHTGLTPDRSPTRSFHSIAATGKYHCLGAVHAGPAVKTTEVELVFGRDHDTGIRLQVGQHLPGPAESLPVYCRVKHLVPGSHDYRVFCESG